MVGYHGTGGSECLLRCTSWNDLFWLLVLDDLFRHLGVDVFLSCISLSLTRLLAFLIDSLILVCCGQSNGYAIYLLVINAICCIFSFVLIVYTNEFVKDPCRCYGYLCSIPASDDLGIFNIGDQSSWIVSECTLRTLEKLPYLNGLLICAVLMLLSNLIYSVVYIAVSVCLQCKGNIATSRANVTFQKEQGTVNFPHKQSYPPYIAAHPSHPSLYREEYLESIPSPSLNGGYRPSPGRQPAPRYSKNNSFDDDDDDRF